MASMNAENAIAAFQTLFNSIPPDKSFQIQMKVYLTDGPRTETWTSRKSSSKPVLLGSGGIFKDLAYPVEAPYLKTLLSSSKSTASSTAGCTLRSQKADIWGMSDLESVPDSVPVSRKKRSMMGLAEINKLSDYDPLTPKPRTPATEYENLDKTEPRSETIYTQKSDNEDEDGNIWVRVSDVFD